MKVHGKKEPRRADLERRRGGFYDGVRWHESPAKVDHDPRFHVFIEPPELRREVVTPKDVRRQLAKAAWRFLDGPGAVWVALVGVVGLLNAVWLVFCLLAP